jgi:hypothetical protein
VFLVWGKKCAGLYETACPFQLHRVSLADGADTAVAVAVQELAP